MKVAVRGGHTPSCTGASCIINEVTEDRRVCAAIIEKFRAYGADVLDVTPPDNYDTVSKEIVYGVAQANTWGADIFISCHFNNCYDYAVESKLGTEIVVKHCDDTGAAMGQNLQQLGFKLRHPESNGQLISERGLYEMRATHMDAYILETCFVESSPDVELYNSVGPEGIAEAIVSAVMGKSMNLGKWIQDSKGWWYKYSDGTYPAECVKKIDGKTYLFNAEGYMEIGWKQLGGEWYYLYSNGEAAVNTWLKSMNNWYFFDNSGVMRTGWVKDNNTWYYLGSDGIMKTGWVQVEGKWHYLYSTGEMATGWIQGGTDWFLLGDSGAMVIGWYKNSNSEWLYLNKDGKMATGFVNIDGALYYFDKNGKMATSQNPPQGYKVGPSGQCTKL